MKVKDIQNFKNNAIQVIDKFTDWLDIESFEAFCEVADAKNANDQNIRCAVANALDRVKRQFEHYKND